MGTATVMSTWQNINLVVGRPDAKTGARIKPSPVRDNPNLFLYYLIYLT